MDLQELTAIAGADWPDGVDGQEGRIKTNLRVEPSVLNGLSKLSIADCLQTRPIDQRLRLVAVRGELEAAILGRSIGFEGGIWAGLGLWLTVLV